MRRTSRSLLALTLVLGPLACSSGGSSSSSPEEAARPVPQSRDTRVLTQAEVDEAIAQNVQTAYDLVMRLRSNWTRTTTVGVRGEQAAPMVWMDNQRLGGIATLRQVPLSQVGQMRHLSPSEAQGLLGMDNVGGAIVITRR